MTLNPLAKPPMKSVSRIDTSSRRRYGRSLNFRGNFPGDSSFLTAFSALSVVMLGLDPSIHATSCGVPGNVDPRVKPEDDEGRGSASIKA